MNSFGNLFKFTSFGESHGEAIGGVIDGCPSGLKIDMDRLREAMKRRRPGQSSLSTQRDEPDEVHFLSGISNDITTGTPIAFIIKNKNVRSSDYSDLKTAFRPSHGDYTYWKKYGHVIFEGGGRASARETGIRCVVGEFAKLILAPLNISIIAYTQSVGPISTSEIKDELLTLENIDSNPVRCPDPAIASLMYDYITKLKTQGDSTGGTVKCIIKNVPAGLGEPVYDKLQSQMAFAMMSINAVKAFEYGGGFDMCARKGSEVNDSMYMHDNDVCFGSNYSGGIQAGISNGADIVFRVGFKPTASISKSQQTIDKMQHNAQITITGRHDPCVVPRAIPIVEAMAAIVLADFYLMNKSKI
ncbi:chorismate synthase [Porphyromonas pogonae]|uniref:chorismate synthase n=1 Tax=Porphyromonas pogonae TaxID=867595 RepID=UPI002E774503|nr:chorismate synthase [Porphyromonas pogonae]